MVVVAAGDESSLSSFVEKLPLFTGSHTHLLCVFGASEQGRAEQGGEEQRSVTQGRSNIHSEEKLTGL